jgi:hypothetical protein
MILTGDSNQIANSQRQFEPILESLNDVFGRSVIPIHISMAMPSPPYIGQENNTNQIRPRSREQEEWDNRVTPARSNRSRGGAINDENPDLVIEDGIEKEIWT